MGWPNAAHRPHTVIHNQKHPVTGAKCPVTVATIPGYGEARLYAKEQALLDLVKAELAEQHPVVIYLRQTGERDIQDRIEGIVEQIPGAQPFILRGSVEAERRERVIEQEVAKGMNVLICNPELVKTGLDLLFAPTLIFYEPTFNLGTMMQAASRSYRLNQTHPKCKVVYLFYSGTMEHQAIQLMSRKQRAAKLLTGDIGLTGLDALTEGETGFEEALLNAIGQEEALLDPRDLFKTDRVEDEISTEDAAFWNVEVTDVTEPVVDRAANTLFAVAVNGQSNFAKLNGDDLGAVTLADFARRELHAVISTRAEGEREGSPNTNGLNGNGTQSGTIAFNDDIKRLVRYVGSYLDSVHMVANDGQRVRLQVQLLRAITQGVDTLSGIGDPAFASMPEHERELRQWVSAWLKQHRFVFTGCEDEVAAQVIGMTQQALGFRPLENELLNMLEAQGDKRVQTAMLDLWQDQQRTLALDGRLTRPTKPIPFAKRVRLSAPEDEPEPAASLIRSASVKRISVDLPQQLALL